MFRATDLKKHRLIFVRGANDTSRHPKMAALIEEAAGQVIRRRFVSLAELIAGVYASLIEYLADQAVNFVLSKIDLAVGTRALGPEAPVA